MIARPAASAGSSRKPYLPAIHLMSFYRERFGHREGEFPVCEDVAARSLALPFFPAMTEGQVARVAGHWRTCSGRWPEAGSRVATRQGPSPGRNPRPHRVVGWRACRASPSRQTGLLAAQHVDRLRLAPWPLRHRAVARAREDARGAGIISEADRDALLAGLQRSRSELEDGDVPVRARRRGHPHGDRAAADGDRRPVGGKLHTARSRNDQVATDVALFTRAHALTTLERLQHLQSVLVAARRRPPRLADARLHAPPARPARLPHPPPARLLLDVPPRPRRFEFVLGSTARPAARRRRAGRRELRRPTAGCWPSELGFASVSPNSIDAVSNRDFVLDYLAAAATCATHLSRLGRRDRAVVSEEFGFCEVSDAWASRARRSMPQKKNPDAAELLRAKAPRVVAHLRALHGRHARASADLQQGSTGGQGASVRRVDTLELCLQAAPGMIGTIDVQPRGDRGARPRTRSSPRPTSPTCSCSRGTPFRESHGMGRLGRRRVAGARGRPAERRPRRHSEVLDDELRRARAALLARVKVSEGGTALDRARGAAGRSRARSSLT